MAPWRLVAAQCVLPFCKSRPTRRAFSQLQLFHPIKTQLSPSFGASRLRPAAALRCPRRASPRPPRGLRAAAPRRHEQRLRTPSAARRQSARLSAAGPPRGRSAQPIGAKSSPALGPSRDWRRGAEERLGEGTVGGDDVQLGGRALVVPRIERADPQPVREPNGRPTPHSPWVYGEAVRRAAPRQKRHVWRRRRRAAEARHPRPELLGRLGRLGLQRKSGLASLTWPPTAPHPAARNSRRLCSESQPRWPGALRACSRPHKTPSPRRCLQQTPTMRQPRRGRPRRRPAAAGRGSAREAPAPHRRASHQPRLPTRAPRPARRGRAARGPRPRRGSAPAAARATPRGRPASAAGHEAHPQPPRRPDRPEPRRAPPRRRARRWRRLGRRG